MIQFSRDGMKVKATVIVAIPNHDTRVFNFFWECSGESYAGLLSRTMHDKLGDRIEEIRKESYNRGWKDAKAKNTKETWFGRWW